MLPKLRDRIHCQALSLRLLLSSILIISLTSITFGQGSGRNPIGTNGIHVIAGYIFFPSGRGADGTIQVKLQSHDSSDLSVIADDRGTFTFLSLSPGNYTVVVNAGKEYEIAREPVFIENESRISGAGMSAIPTSRRYTVMINLQPKESDTAKASVINAAMAGVPDKARALYEKALDLSRLGNHAKAVDILRTAISLSPKFSLALNELGVQYLRLGQADKAVEPLRSALKLNPDSFAPKLNLGIALLETQQLTEAETQLREVLKLASAPTAHMYLGLTLARLHNDEEAERELRLAIDVSGNQLGLAHYYLAGLYWRQREYHRAAEEFETYLRLTPNAQDAERVRKTIKELRNK